MVKQSSTSALCRGRSGAARGCLALLAFLAVVGTYVGLGFVDPLYTADTRILIEQRESPLTRPREQAADPTTDFDESAIQSQVEVLRSREIAEAVIDNLNLTTRPEFDPASQAFAHPLAAGGGRDRQHSDRRHHPPARHGRLFRAAVGLSAAEVARDRRGVLRAQSCARGGSRECRRRRFRQTAAGRQAPIGRRGDGLAAAGDLAAARTRGGRRAGGRRLSHQPRPLRRSTGPDRIPAAIFRRSSSATSTPSWRGRVRREPRRKRAPISCRSFSTKAARSMPRRRC